MSPSDARPARTPSMPMTMTGPRGRERIHSEERIPKNEFRRTNSEERIPKNEFRRTNSEERIPKNEFRRTNSEERIPKNEFRTPYSVLRTPNSDLRIGSSPRVRRGILAPRALIRAPG